MRQYLDVKRVHRDALVVFRMGDFYEMFYEDAVAAARVLELTLTSRAKDASGTAIPMCGFPFHALDTYLGRLIRKGYRVAICDQVEDPKKAKGLVKREVTRVVSPGTFTESSYLDAREPAFLAALSFGTGTHPTIGIAFLDTSTGEFAACECTGPGARSAASAELAVIRPKELLIADEADITDLLPVFATVRVTRVEGWTLDAARAQETLLAQFRVSSLSGYGLDHAPLAVAAAGAVVDYVRATQKADLTHVRDISLRSSSDALAIDPVTLRHLNVVEGVDGGREGSLLDAIDRTMTAMGGRQLRGWLLRPLVTVERIQDRLDAVEDFAFRTTERGKMRDTLKGMHDVERLMARISLGTGGPRDFTSLGQSLALVPRVRMLLSELSAPLVKSLVAEIDELADVRGDIAQTLVDDPAGPGARRRRRSRRRRS
jgi:DNA mismatch repair protein MutS